MDQTRFDHLTRRLGAGTSRRTGLKAALGGLLGLATGLATLPAHDGGAKKKKKKKRSAACGAPCPSGQACADGACTCTRELCGDACCAGNQSCQDGRCVETGRRDCSGVAIVDGADLSHCNLRGRTIAVGTLRNANFEGADLTDARFTGRFQPWGCSFRGAWLERTDFYECDIKPGTSFAGAFLQWADFTGGRIDGADFTDANMQMARFHRINGDNAQPYYAKFTDTRFVRADLTGADLEWCEFRNADLSEANLTTTNLYTARVYSSSFRGANMLGANLKSTLFQSTVLDGANLDGAAFGNHHLQNYQWWSERTRFHQCSMVGVSMRGQIPVAWKNNPSVEFIDVNLRDAQFDIPYQRERAAWLRTDLTGASGWQQPTGDYRWWCSNTLPSGETSPDGTWFTYNVGFFSVTSDPVPCNRAPAPRQAGS